ncbi:MAG: Lrp/AsnC family transcriptional regulator [Candidatus Lokiarchaeota archaeon]|nr:Lrp/AsnC family transcriptional regulator [Candidatus Harpocratesius repetitus]
MSTISKIDDIDKSIINMLQNNPYITHSQIAKELDRSQPAIGARIKKLTENGILATQIGVDFSNPEVNSVLNLVKVELTTTHPEDVFNLSKVCPYIINALKISGEYNILMFMACSSLKRLDTILDRHFRNKDYVKKIRMDLVTSYAHSFILPVDFMAENFDNPDDPCNVTTCPHCETILAKQK